MQPHSLARSCFSVDLLYCFSFFIKSILCLIQYKTHECALGNRQERCHCQAWDPATEGKQCKHVGVSFRASFLASLWWEHFQPMSSVSLVIENCQFPNGILWLTKTIFKKREWKHWMQKRHKWRYSHSSSVASLVNLLAIFHILKHISIRKRNDESAAIWKSTYFFKMNTFSAFTHTSEYSVMKQFTVIYHSPIGTYSDKCVSQQFQHNVNMIENRQTHIIRMDRMSLGDRTSIIYVAHHWLSLLHSDCVYWHQLSPRGSKWGDGRQLNRVQGGKWCNYHMWIHAWIIAIVQLPCKFSNILGQAMTGLAMWHEWGTGSWGWGSPWSLNIWHWEVNLICELASSLFHGVI